METIITWKEDYKTGHQEIDRQHHMLVDIINELYDLLMGGGYKLESSHIAKLKGYIEDHFAYEEGVFRKGNLPTLDKHIKRHRDFIAQIEKVEKQSQEEMGLPLADTVQFLADWLNDHILAEDKTSYKSISS